MTNPFALTKTDRDGVKTAPESAPQRSCSKCAGAIGAGNKSGVCTPCQKPHRKRPVGDKLNTAALLRESAPRPVAPKELTRSPAAWSEIPSVTELRKVAFTLGLDGAQILTSFADAWLDRVLAAAHAAAEGPKVAAPPSSPTQEASL